jgi:hypothetical protein
VTRRELLQRAALGAGAVALLALAAVLTLLAVDVIRWNDALRSGDVRYRVSPAAEGLWQADELTRGGVAKALLAVGDDIEFRQAIQALHAARLDDAVVSDPELAIRRNEAQARLEAIVTRKGDPFRRSRAAGLLGVLGVARFVWETQDRDALISGAVSNLQLAIALDPENDEAKHNLELAFQRGRGYQLSEGSGGTNPTAGGSGAKGAGAGQPGTGY